MRRAAFEQPCPYSWDEDGVRVDCIRLNGHDGRHIARHPTAVGEHVFWPREREEKLRVPA